MLHANNRASLVLYVTARGGYWYLAMCTDFGAQRLDGPPDTLGEKSERLIFRWIVRLLNRRIPLLLGVLRDRDYFVVFNKFRLRLDAGGRWCSVTPQWDQHHNVIDKTEP